MTTIPLNPERFLYAAIAAAEAEFGRSLSKRERAVFIRTLDDVSATKTA